MSGITQKILEIENEVARTQRNKNTEGHLGLLKAKLAKLRREQVDSIMSKAGGGYGEGFDVMKSGDARVGLIGFPSVGKSTLLIKLTDTFSEVHEREFTTLTCIPGVIRYKGSKLQLLDLPGIIEGAKDGKGKGRQVIGVARTCNLILVVLDAVKPLSHKRIIENELEGVGIRLNRKQPDISIKPNKGGGIIINRGLTSDVKMSDDTITSILKEYKVNNAEVVLRGKCGVDDLIDAVEGNRVYIPALYVINKIDQITVEELDLLDQIPNYVLVSAHKLWNLDELLDRVFEKLDLTRVYTKPKGQVPDYESPVILNTQRCKVEDFCAKIHKTFIRDFKYAIVWGSSVKHQPSKVGKDHLLLDEDVIQIVKKI